MIWPHHKRGRVPDVDVIVDVDVVVDGDGDGDEEQLGAPGADRRACTVFSVSTCTNAPSSLLPSLWRSAERCLVDTRISATSSGASPFGSPERRGGSPQGFRGRCRATFRDCPWFRDGMC